MRIHTYYREWQPRAKHGLEALYNRPAASASDDTLSPLRCTAPDASSSVAVLEAMQSWVSSIIVQAEQYEVSQCTSCMQHLCRVTRTLLQ
jgi:hypothetical protein